MAETKNTKPEKKSTPAPTPVVEEELNLDTKVTVRSIADWNTGFARKVDGVGDINIPPLGTIRLSRSEIIGQVQAGNRLFSGTDGRGSHATLIIDDIPTRVELDFETKDGKVKQNVFSDDKIKSLFAITSTDSFKEKFKDEIVTRAEKYATIKAIERLGLDGYSKIRFIEDYTGYKLQ